MRKLVSVGLVFAVAMLLVCQGTAWAGGGGAKANAWIRVTNNSAEIAAVMVDPPANVATLTPEQFLAKGGKVLEPGKKFDFKVVAGKHTVFAVLIDGDGNAIANPTTRKYSVDKGKTLKLVLTGEAGGDTTLTP